MNSMPFRQLNSFLKILIGVQYDDYISYTPMMTMPAKVTKIQA